MVKSFLRLCLTGAALIGFSLSANADLTAPAPCTTILSNVQTGGGKIGVNVACDITYHIDHINIPEGQIVIISEEALKELRARNGGPLSTEEFDIMRKESRRLNRQGVEDTARTTIITLADIAASPEQPLVDADESLKAAARASASGQFDEAKRLFEVIRTPALQNPALRTRAAADACFGLAILAELKLDYPGAETYLREAMSWQPQDPKYLAYLSQFLAFAGRASEAVPLAVQAEALVAGDTGGNRVRTYRWIGDAYQDSLFFTKALDAYDKAQKEWESRPGLKADYAQILLSAAGLDARLRNFEPAEELYTKVLQSDAINELTKSEKLAFWNNLGVFYVNAGCSEAAREYAEFVLKHEGRELQSDDPLVAFSLGVLGRAFYIDSNLPEAVQTLQKAIDAIGRSFDGRHWRAAQFRTYKAEVLLAMKDFDGAQTLLSEAIRILDAKPEEAHLQFAITLAMLSRTELANADPDASRTLARAERYLNSIAQIAQAEPLWRIKLARAEEAILVGDMATSKGQLLEALEADHSYGVRVILKKDYHVRELESVLREINNDLSLRTKLSLPPTVKCSSAPVPSLL